MDQIEKELRLVAVRNQIAKRIRRVCSNLSPDEFETLLDRMTLLRYKYECLPNLPSATIDDTSSETLELRR